MNTGNVSKFDFGRLDSSQSIIIKQGGMTQSIIIKDKLRKES
jgi:hypothetical protein